MTTDRSPSSEGTAAEILRSNTRLRVLAEVSHAFAMVATGYQSLIETIARVTADLVGDGCLVTLISADGEQLVNAANAHRDPTVEDAYRAYLAGMGIARTTSASVAAQVIRSGQPRLVAEMAPETLVAQTDEALKPLVARLNVHSFAVVPIRARQTIIGSLSLLRSGPGRGYTVEDLTLMQDLADRAGLALENARLYDDLERRVRERTAALEAVNQELEAFSYSVAHDLRAPLRSIEGFSQILLEDYQDRLDDTGQDYLRRVRASSLRMSELIDDLLQLSRATRGELHAQQVDLTALATDIAQGLQRAEPQRPAAFSIQPGLVANADARLLRVAMENLLGNDWKFTRSRAPAQIEVGAREQDGRTVYFVRDNGAGFDMAQASKLFGAFQRLHAANEFPGTGIGLATVKRVIHRLGGEVWAEGVVDQGATFYFYL